MALFDTKEKTEEATEIIKIGITTSFWKLMGEVLQANIDIVTTLIVNGNGTDGEKATKEEMDRLRDKLRVYKEIKDTPLNLIKSLTSPAVSAPNPDPYETLEDMKEARKKMSKD